MVIKLPSKWILRLIAALIAAAVTVGILSGKRQPPDPALADTECQARLQTTEPR